MIIPLTGKQDGVLSRRVGEPWNGANREIAINGSFSSRSLKWIRRKGRLH
jgi:hypothetical protein